MCYRKLLGAAKQCAGKDGLPPELSAEAFEIEYSKWVSVNGFLAVM